MRWQPFLRPGEEPDHDSANLAQRARELNRYEVLAFQDEDPKPTRSPTPPRLMAVPPCPIRGDAMLQRPEQQLCLGFELVRERAHSVTMV
jgi:hypothetical protein